jgi:Ca2+-binding RTX toxin-like protein
MLGRALALTGILVLGTGAASASAATLSGHVRSGTEETDGTPFGGVLYKASRGEVNRLTVREVGGRTVFRDSGAVIRVRGNCKSISLHAARCPFSEDQARVRLGDRNDRARLKVDFGPEIFGGAGNDRIVGGSGYDTLYGDLGKDTIRGGGGGDEVHGGGGPDRLFGGGGDDTLFDDRRDGPTSGDLFDGGPGSGDAVDYSRRTKGLNLDLARNPVNNSSEGDRIVHIENVHGGRGPDRIAGTERRNILDGGGGDDHIDGRGGRDFVQGRKGDDTVLGGAGGDILRGDDGEDSLQGGDGADLIYGADRDVNGDSDREADAVQCGEGNDSFDGGPLDTIADCELATPWEGVLRMAVLPQVAGDKATFTTRCDAEAGDECTGTISLKSPEGVVYGSGRFSVPDQSELPKGMKTATFSVTLTPQGQAAFKAGAVVAVALKPDEDTSFDGGTAGYRTFMQGG